MRKAVQTELAPKNLPRFRPIQATETELLLGKLHDNPDAWMEHVRMYAKAPSPQNPPLTSHPAA